MGAEEIIQADTAEASNLNVANNTIPNINTYHENFIHPRVAMSGSFFLQKN